MHIKSNNNFFQLCRYSTLRLLYPFGFIFFFFYNVQMVCFLQIKSFQTNVGTVILDGLYPVLIDCKEVLPINRKKKNFLHSIFLKSVVSACDVWSAIEYHTKYVSKMTSFCCWRCFKRLVSRTLVIRSI